METLTISKSEINANLTPKTRNGTRSNVIGWLLAKSQVGAELAKPNDLSSYMLGFTFFSTYFMAILYRV